MSATVLVMSLLVERLWVVLPKSPYFESLENIGITFGIMLFGGVIAFLMVRIRLTLIAPHTGWAETGHRKRSQSLDRELPALPELAGTCRLLVFPVAAHLLQRSHLLCV